MYQLEGAPQPRQADLEDPVNHGSQNQGPSYDEQRGPKEQELKALLILPFWSRRPGHNSRILTPSPTLDPGGSTPEGASSGPGATKAPDLCWADASAFSFPPREMRWCTGTHQSNSGCQKKAKERAKNPHTQMSIPEKNPERRRGTTQKFAKKNNEKKKCRKTPWGQHNLDQLIRLHQGAKKGPWRVVKAPGRRSRGLQSLAVPCKMADRVQGAKCASPRSLAAESRLQCDHMYTTHSTLAGRW